MARDREEGSAISDRIWNARIACTDDAAYVAMILMDSHREAVVDPETGCYAVLRKSTPDRTLRVARILRTAPWCSPGAPRRLRRET